VTQPDEQPVLRDLVRRRAPGRRRLPGRGRRLTLSITHTQPPSSSRAHRPAHRRRAAGRPRGRDPMRAASWSLPAIVTPVVGALRNALGDREGRRLTPYRRPCLSASAGRHLPRRCGRHHHLGSIARPSSLLDRVTAAGRSAYNHLPAARRFIQRSAEGGKRRGPTRGGRTAGVTSSARPTRLLTGGRALAELTPGGPSVSP